MEFPISGLVSFKELSERLGRTVRTLVHEASLLPCPQHIARQLNIAEKEPIWKIVRAREIEGERVILDKDYFLASVIPFLSSEIAANRSTPIWKANWRLKSPMPKKKFRLNRSLRRISYCLI